MMAVGAFALTASWIAAGAAASVAAVAFMFIMGKFADGKDKEQEK